MRSDKPNSKIESSKGIARVIQEADSREVRTEYKKTQRPENSQKENMNKNTKVPARRGANSRQKKDFSTKHVSKQDSKQERNTNLMRQTK